MNVEDKINSSKRIFLKLLEKQNFKYHLNNTYLLVEKAETKLIKYVKDYQKDCFIEPKINELIIWFSIFLSNEINDKNISPKIISLGINILISSLGKLNRELPNELIEETKKTLNIKYLNQPKNIKYTTNIIGVSLCFKYASKVIINPNKPTS